MLHDQNFEAALAIQRRMYTTLMEVSDLTDQLSQALSRQDQVSVRMFLSMRQEEINHLQAFQNTLLRLCTQLPPEDGALLRRLLSGGSGSPPSSPNGKAVQQQAERNRAMLERICRADEAVSRRLGGANSFYAKQSRP